MTPEHIRALLTQTGLTQTGLAAELNAIDPLMRCAQTTVSRWLMATDNPNARTPDVRSADALARVWLAAGYPCTATLHDGRITAAILTTQHATSSYGAPVAVIDGVAHGYGDLRSLALPDAPAAIVERVARAGYRLSSTSDA